MSADVGVRCTFISYSHRKGHGAYLTATARLTYDNQRKIISNKANSINGTLFYHLFDGTQTVSDETNNVYF